MSPLARSLTLLRRLGYIADPVERFIAAVQRKRDLWGFGDILAAHPRDGIIVIVQATTRAHLGDRLRKAQGKPALASWLKAGGAFEVDGWELRAGKWVVKRVAVEAASLKPVTLTCPPRRRREARQGLLFGG